MEVPPNEACYTELYILIVFTLSHLRLLLAHGVLGVVELEVLFWDTIIVVDATDVFAQE